MEPTLIFTIGLAVLLAGRLALDAIRSRMAARLHVGWLHRFRPYRTTVVAIAMSSLWAARMPATASTPPPSVRLLDHVDVRGVSPVTANAAHEVRSGDCLWRIARSLLIERGQRASGGDIARAWRAIYDVNRSVIGDDPDLIHPGQVLEIPQEL